MKENEIIIIEDERSAKNHLTKLIDQTAGNFKIIASFSTISDTVQWLQNNNSPHLIFMDIHLSDGLSFDIFEEVAVECPVIYTTAYDEYAIKAFKTTGIDYLLKPITQNDLDNALKKYDILKQNYNHWNLKNIDALNLYHTSQNPTYKKRFLFRNGNNFIPVKTENIAYFYRDEIVFAKCFDGNTYPMDESLNQLQKMTPPTSFVRLNRQILMNINAIEKLISFRPGQVSIQVKPDYPKDIILSQERSSWLKQFLGK